MFGMGGSQPGFGIPDLRGMLGSHNAGMAGGFNGAGGGGGDPAGTMALAPGGGMDVMGSLKKQSDFATSNMNQGGNAMSNPMSGGFGMGF